MQRQIDSLRESEFRRSEGLVEVVAISPTSAWPWGAYARARIVRVYKGNFRAGQVIDLYTTPNPCFVTALAAGSRGVTYLMDRKNAGWTFLRYVTPGEFAALKEKRLIP
ncbi:MAG TPA: hypothetical protein VF481_14715 [Novosphingobium sp.]